MCFLCHERWWDKSRSTRGAERAEGCDNCLEVGVCWIFFGFVDKHQCVESDVGSYGKTVDEVQQWNGRTWEGWK